MVPPPSSQMFQPRACKTCLTPPSPVIPSTSKSSPHILHDKQQLSTSTVPITSHTGSPASLCSCNSQLTGPRATPLEKVPKIMSLLLLKPQGLPLHLQILKHSLGIDVTLVPPRDTLGSLEFLKMSSCSLSKFHNLAP